MLLGEYAHTIDDKNRLTLPAKFRESFADGGVVTRGLDGCLYLYASGEWESLVGSRLAPWLPGKPLKMILAVMLIFVGARLLLAG